MECCALHAEGRRMKRALSCYLRIQRNLMFLTTTKMHGKIQLLLLTKCAMIRIRKQKNLYIILGLRSFETKSFKTWKPAEKFLLPSLGRQPGQLHCITGLWFRSYLVAISRSDQVDFNFLEPGHTKNICDRAFGCVKKTLKQRDVFSYWYERCFNESAFSAKAVPASEVNWIEWKSFFKRFF